MEHIMKTKGPFVVASAFRLRSRLIAMTRMLPFALRRRAFSKTTLKWNEVETKNPLVLEEKETNYPESALMKHNGNDVDCSDEANSPVDVEPCTFVLRARFSIAQTKSLRDSSSMKFFPDSFQLTRERLAEILTATSIWSKNVNWKWRKKAAQSRSHSLLHNSSSYTAFGWMMENH